MLGVKFVSPDQMERRLDEILHEVKEGRQDFHEHDKNDEGRHATVMGIVAAHNSRLVELEKSDSEKTRASILRLRDSSTWVSRNWLPTVCLVVSTAVAVFAVLHK